MDLAILQDEEKFRRHVLEVLTSSPLDYLSQMEFVKEEEKGPAPWDWGGVLLPISFSRDPRTGLHRKGEYVFLLSKRSMEIPQGGDLCAPGGRSHLVWDSVFQRFLQLGLMPGAKRMRTGLIRSREKRLYQMILFFWSNSLRESWEELRLPPWNVEFLGPLQTYRLQSRRWVIFPLVGRIKKAWNARLSPEVEKLVEIPLTAFFQPGQYAICHIQSSPEKRGQASRESREFPCFFYGDKGKEEVLWGATFNIIREFLQVVLERPLPSPDGQRIIHRSLARNYYTGTQENRKGHP